MPYPSHGVLGTASIPDSLRFASSSRSWASRLSFILRMSSSAPFLAKQTNQQMYNVRKKKGANKKKCTMNTKRTSKQVTGIPRSLGVLGAPSARGSGERRLPSQSFFRCSIVPVNKG